MGAVTILRSVLVDGEPQPAGIAIWLDLEDALMLVEINRAAFVNDADFARAMAARRATVARLVRNPARPGVCPWGPLQ